VLPERSPPPAITIPASSFLKVAADPQSATDRDCFCILRAIIVEAIDSDCSSGPAVWEQRVEIAAVVSDSASEYVASQSEQNKSSATYRDSGGNLQSITIQSPGDCQPPNNPLPWPVGFASMDLIFRTPRVIAESIFTFTLMNPWLQKYFEPPNQEPFDSANLVDNFEGSLCGSDLPLPPRC